MGERRTATGWRLDEESGRLYAPNGSFVARIVGGRIVFYDRKQQGEVMPGLSVADWFELLFGDANAPAGAWGRRPGR
ncbi:MAG: hypothetical protein KDE23_19180 [Caldilinea sp.]|nr:hypothetical protein [Caldilinea sp.]